MMAGVMVLSLSACGGSKKTEETKTAEAEKDPIIAVNGDDSPYKLVMVEEPKVPDTSAASAGTIHKG